MTIQIHIYIESQKSKIVHKCFLNLGSAAYLKYKKTQVKSINLQNIKPMSKVVHCFLIDLQISQNYYK